MAARGRSTEKKSSASGSNKFPVKGAVAGSSVVNGTPKARRSVSATKNTRSPTPAAKLTVKMTLQCETHENYFLQCCPLSQDTSYWDVLLFYPNIIGQYVIYMQLHKLKMRIFLIPFIIYIYQGM